MRFLCLHGIGTNNQIFKMQTAAFRYELADQHTYEFVQGTIPWDLPSVELKTLSDSSNQHYAYYDTTSPSSFIAALDNLEAYIDNEGPFDGVLAYSQGAGLIAMLLVRMQLLQPETQCPFRCAILFSPVQIYDPVAYIERGEISILHRKTPSVIFPTIPVVIIFGEVDERRDECIGVQDICDPDLTFVFMHEGGHEVPGIGAKGGLPGSIKAARRGITQADLAIAC
ncbi:serine hydrolase FSH [Xylaria scruposa]|nr:serine hydrolase FSH [Xylaria scruposa]